MAINGQPLDQTVTHQQAIGILQRASECVQLTIARGPIPQLASPVVSRTPSAASTLSAHSSAVRGVHTQKLVEAYTYINTLAHTHTHTNMSTLTFCIHTQTIVSHIPGGASVMPNL